VKRDWDSFVSIVPDVEDVLDDDRQCRQCSEGHAKVSYQRVRHNVGDQKTASRTTDPDAEVSERFGEVGHGLDWFVFRSQLQSDLRDSLIASDYRFWLFNDQDGWVNEWGFHKIKIQQTRRSLEMLELVGRCRT